MAAGRSRRCGARERRAPEHRLRMLRRSPTAAPEPRNLPECAVVRIAVPRRIVRLVELGLGELGDRSPGWRRHVERVVGELVDAHVPRPAADVRIWLDDDRFEVVVEYRLPADAA